jgi:transcriptional regulator with XRE-family HTH domain
MGKASPPVPGGIISVILDYMAKYHVTQHELAARTGICQPNLSRAFRGVHRLSSEHIDRILAALEVKAKLVPLPWEMPDLDNLDDW